MDELKTTKGKISDFDEEDPNTRGSTDKEDHTKTTDENIGLLTGNKKKPDCCGGCSKIEINTENNHALVLGIFWYLIVLGITYWGILPGHILHWRDSDIMQSFTVINILSLMVLMLLTVICLIVIHKLLNKEFDIYKYIILCAIIFVAEIIGSFEPLYDVGFGASFWCIMAGIVFRIFSKTPNGFLNLDFYIKVAIVLLAVDLNEVLLIGAKSLVVGWVETTFVFLSVLIFGILVLKVDKTLAIGTSVALSICGASAIVAVKDIIKLDDKSKKYIIIVMSIFTIPYIPILPVLSNKFNLNNNTAGAWIGGCVDTTGAVLASASLLPLEGFHTAIIIKMVQNVWIVAFIIGLSIYINRSFSCSKVWDSFPKFILGFILTGLITTFLPDPFKTNVVNNSFIISEWFSSISFVLIGYEIDIFTIHKDLNDNFRVMILYIIGQVFDTFTTFGIAFIMFTLIS